jgi:hypothetical protein
VGEVSESAEGLYSFAATFPDWSSSMKKIQGPKISSPAKASTPKAAEKASKPAAVTEAMVASTFARTGWANPAKLAKSIQTAHAPESHPRLVHARPANDPIGGEPTRPAVVLRSGSPLPVIPPTVAIRHGAPPTPVLRSSVPLTAAPVKPPTIVVRSTRPR